MVRKVVLFFTSTLCLYASNTNISLDEMLKYLDTNSYQNRIYNLQEKIEKDKEKYYKLDDFNGINTSINSEYSDREDSFQTTGRIEYGPFYLEGSKNYNSENETVYGIEKSLKDLIYSSSKSELKKLEYDKEISNLEYLKNLEEQKVSLINLYKEYRDTELEIQIKENGIKTLKTEEEKMKKSYSLGAIAKIELDSIQYSMKNLEIEVATLKNNLNNLRKRFSFDYGIEVGDKTLDEIVAPKVALDRFIENYGKKDLEILEKQNAISQERINYLEYDDMMPEITLGVEHSDKYDENRVIAKFSKPLFALNIDLENEKDSLKQQEINLEQKRLENSGEKLKIYNTFYEYEKNYYLNKNSAELELSKYNIKKLEYSLGKVDYLEVMDSFDAYLNYEIAKEKAKNNLNGYIYEIMVRGA